MYLINKLTHKTILSSIGTIVLLSAVLFSCKKEDAKIPYTEVVNFTVDVEGEAVKAAVDNDKIILYWPLEKDIPETISPVINVSKNATISPASGATISTTETVVYTVTSETGAVRKYTLYIPNNKVKPYIKSWDGLTLYNGKAFIVEGNQINIRGDYFSTKENGSRVFITNENNQEVEAEIVAKTGLVFGFRPKEIGTYKKFRFESAGYTFTFDTVFHYVSDPFSRISYPTENITVKQGEDFVLTGKNLDKISSVVLTKLSGGDQYELVIKNATSATITLTTPATIPTGEYNYLLYKQNAGEYHDIINGQLALWETAIIVTN
ncbi:hypothetical protein [Gynurincola endophyticus]|uniref:hypothetical protein n=1 Tax=Gynurincola endophyticus TaxID=2479004 RepID=UPI000F8E05B8|nr:hypothetical protein [Gynurincola endophyticus]